jgi:hypothetical protein
MARPNKMGLQYYNIDTDRYSDIRIRRLKNALGCTGIAVYDYILCAIYHNGGVLSWGENTVLDVAEYFALKENTIMEVVNYCCSAGLFNKELFASESVLTSKSIQERYVYICKKAKIRYKIDSKFNLISSEEFKKTTEDLSKTTEDLQKNAVESTQIKGNKIKLNTKEKEKEKETAKRFLPPSVDEVKKFVSEKNYSVDAEAFIAFYQSKNWYIGKNKMKDWRAAVVTWEKRNREFKKQTQPTNNVNDIWR